MKQNITAKTKAPSCKWMEHCSYYELNLEGLAVGSSREIGFKVRASMFSQPYFRISNGDFGCFSAWRTVRFLGMVSLQKEFELPNYLVPPLCFGWNRCSTFPGGTGRSRCRGFLYNRSGSWLLDLGGSLGLDGVAFGYLIGGRDRLICVVAGRRGHGCMDAGCRTLDCESTF